MFFVKWEMKVYISSLSLLSCHRARHLYRIESLHPPVHAVTAVVLRYSVKGTSSINDMDEVWP